MYKRQLLSSFNSYSLSLYIQNSPFFIIFYFPFTSLKCLPSNIAYVSSLLPIPFLRHCHPRNKPGCCVADFHRFFCQLSSAGDYATDGSDLRYNGWSGPGLHPLLQCFVPFCDLIRYTDRLPFGWFRLSFPWNCSSGLLHQLVFGVVTVGCHQFPCCLVLVLSASVSKNIITNVIL